MLQILLPEREYFDEINSTFITLKSQVLRLEHSLISLSKWESNWNKPFLTKDKKTVEEIIDYLKCMSLDSGIADIVYQTLPDYAVDQIDEYISKPMTATWFSESNSTINNDIITAELIYCQMVLLGIPFECQKWHLNRLFTLIRVCQIKTSPPKKMGKQQILAQNRALNEARRAKYQTKG